MLNRYKARRDAAIKELGGKCKVCGSPENLDFDHRDPSTKLYTLGNLLAGGSEALVQAELKKCQLLCEKCHDSKTLTDLGQESAKITHGTLSSHRYCKCRLCKDVWNAYHRELKAKNKMNS